jgi:hypothetical protein
LDNFNRLLAERGKVSNLDVARFLGCGEGTISRIRNGEQTAGAGFIACVAVAMGPDSLAEVFDFGQVQS